MMYFVLSYMLSWVIFYYGPACRNRDVVGELLVDHGICFGVSLFVVGLLKALLH